MAVKGIVIGCDNAAVGLKEEIKRFLENKGFSYEDVGVHFDNDATYYPEVAKRVVDTIRKSGYTKDGILICGTGIGMAITANKFPGIYAAVCHDTYSAERLRLSNNGNVICMGARVIGPELAKRILQEWLGLEFKDGSSTPKVGKIKEYEGENFKEQINQ